MIRKVQADRHKAASLRTMAEITLHRLDETDKEKYPSNTLRDYYDALHGLMESLALLGGVKITGEGAHKELIEYMAKKQVLGEQNRVFLQQMRRYRNRISYEGFMVSKNYIQLNISTITAIIEILLEKIGDCT